MKKRKFGFTVAEMVTAMTIVGIMSAFVIPLSIKTFHKHQAGIILGRAVEQIISGNQNMIQMANMNSDDEAFVDSLVPLTQDNLYNDDYTTTSVLDNLQNFIPPFWKLTSTQVDSPSEIRKFNGDKIDGSNIAKKDTAHRFNFSRIPASIALYRPEGDSWIIYIDTNGFKSSPNTYGKDIFAFELNDDGTLRPFGGKDSNGLELTEKVVQDGFRITYY